MNHIVISTLLDLKNITNEPLDVSEKQTSTYFPNMWGLTFDENLIKSMQLDDLKQFFIELLDNWHHQLLKIDPELRAKFYLWFDKQALQLRFNLLLNINSHLPFGCKIDINHSLEQILNEFLTVTYEIAKHSEHIEFIDPASALEDHDEVEHYILKVYVKILQR
jgi:hypothetical protein